MQRSRWFRRFSRRTLNRAPTLPGRRRRIAFESLEDRRLLAVDLISRAHPSLISDSAGGYSSADSFGGSSISADGRYVAFQSDSGNLVHGVEPVQFRFQVYRYDRLTGDVVLVSVNSTGTGGGNGSSGSPVISADGSVVAFGSSASDLHPLDTNTTADIYAHDFSSGALHLVSVNSTGMGGGNGVSYNPVISADGGVVAFVSEATSLHPLDTNAIQDIYARDLSGGTTQLVSVNVTGTGGGDHQSWDPVISADGNVVAFSSGANNLHSLDRVRNRPFDFPRITESDVFARDLSRAITHLVSLNSVGTASGNSSSFDPSISASGQTVAFVSQARDIHSLADGNMDIYVRDLSSGTTQLASVNTTGTASIFSDCFAPRMSANGTVVAFRTDGGIPDIYAHDLSSGTTHLVTMNSAGTGGGNGFSFDHQISSDGTAVLFASESSNLHPLDTSPSSDVFLRHLPSGTTELVTLNRFGIGSGNGSSSGPMIRADGQSVVFTSTSNNLVAGDLDSTYDVFVRTLSSSSTELVSQRDANLPSASAGGASALNKGGDFVHIWSGSVYVRFESRSISADGRYVAFESTAPNLVPVVNTLQGVRQIYRYDRYTGEMVLVSVNSAGTGGGNADSFNPTISADGSVVAFESNARNLHPLDSNSRRDIFARDLSRGLMHLVSINSASTASGNADSSNPPVISANGRIVAFVSRASDLHVLDMNRSTDVFARDLWNNATHFVSINSAGTASGDRDSSHPVINADGSIVAFNSEATNLHPFEWSADQTIFARDLFRRTTRVVGGGFVSAISADGNVIAYEGVHPQVLDRRGIYAHNLLTDGSQLVSVNIAGTGNGNGSSKNPVLSANGRVIAFESTSSDLHPLDNDTESDVFARDLVSNTTYLVSMNIAGTAGGNGSSTNAVISGDGRAIAFVSSAIDLDELDTDSGRDVFVRYLTSSTTDLASVTRSGSGSGDRDSTDPVISDDGRVIIFASEASNLVLNDFNGSRDLFALELKPVPFAVGADAGGGPHVRLFHGGSADEKFSFFAFDPAFTGGVRVAMGDVTGDGVPDIIAAAGAGGGPHVRVFDGITGEQIPGPLGSFMAYDASFSGGVFVAAADFNGDGLADIVTGAGAGGGPHIRVFSGADGSELVGFFDPPKGGNGVRVTTGDINGDGTPDIITGSGSDVPATVRVFGGLTAQPVSGALGTIAPYPGFQGGVYVAAGDVNGDGRDDVITGAGGGRSACQSLQRHGWHGDRQLFRVRSSIHWRRAGWCRRCQSRWSARHHHRRRTGRRTACEGIHAGRRRDCGLLRLQSHVHGRRVRGRRGERDQSAAVVQRWSPGERRLGD